MVRLSLLLWLPRLLPPQRLLSTKVQVEVVPRLLYPRMGGHVDVDERVEEFQRVGCLSGWVGNE